MPWAYYMIIMRMFWQNQSCDTQVLCMRTLVGNNIIFNNNKHQCSTTLVFVQLHLKLVVTWRTLQKQQWDHIPNWTPREMMALVDAQGDIFLNKLDSCLTLQMLGTLWMHRQQIRIRSWQVYDTRFFNLQARWYFLQGQVKSFVAQV